MTMRVLGVLSQLGLLVFAVAMGFDVLAVLAGALFVWQGTSLVYAVLSDQELPSLTEWATSKVSRVAASDGAWAVAVGIGVVLMVGGGLVSIAHPHRDGWHYVGWVLFAMTAWTLGLMRRARLNSRPEQ